MSGRLLHAALALLLLGCAGETVAPVTETPPGPPPELPARVLVVNTLSETISSLDPEGGAMTVQAALAGTWVNRITALGDGRRLLLTNSGANEIEVLDTLNLAGLGAIDLGPGKSPWIAVALDGSRALVTTWLGGTLEFVRVEGGVVETPLPLTPGPEGIAVDGRRAYVACTNYSASGYGEGRLDVVDLASWKRVASIPVGKNPQDVVIVNGRIHVLCTGDYTAQELGSVHVVEPVGLEVSATVPVGGAPGRLVADGHGLVWVVGFDGGVKRYDEASYALLPDPPGEVLRRPGLSAIAFDAVTDKLYVTSFDDDLLISVDRSTAIVLDAWIVGDGPVDVLVHRPDTFLD